MHHNIKKRIYQDNDRYQARLEEVDGVLYVHVEVYQMTKSTLSLLRKEFDILKKKVKEAGYSHLFTYTSNSRFYKLFPGCRPVGDYDWQGQHYEVMTWDLK
jgi:hypothetical protein